MPQDTLRSSGYRSFVRCDDPNGVVECGTIRKSKTSSRKMERRIENRRTQKDHSKVCNPSLVCKEEKKELVSEGITKELQTSPPSQLLEVSKGAQKINEMIESWSKGLSFDGHSKDIARDLLKGALDLQESLLILGKLQEASKCMAGLNKKQKQKFEPEGEEGDDVGIERIGSDRFGDRNYQIGLQQPRLSVDGYSRNCREELKKLVRDSFSRQNLLPTRFTEENHSWGRRKYDPDMDIPSTSSSQSSVVHSKNSASPDCSVSSATQEKKAKAPNLIAKLMGLEELPSEPIQTSKIQVESEENSNQRRPIFDIDMPKQRKPQFVDPNVDPERRTLKEIIEAMQFKRLLKSNHVEGRMLQSHLSDSAYSKQRMDDKNPPIVIIKPLSFPCLETEGPLSKRHNWKERALEPKYILKKQEAITESPTKMLIREEGGSLDEPPTKLLVRKEEAFDRKVMLRKLEAKEMAPSNRFMQGERGKDSKEIVRKMEVKELKAKEKASFSKMKASVPLNLKPQKKESTNKEAEKIEKVSPDRRKPLEKEKVKSVVVSRYQDHAKATSTKLQKSENGSIITKKRVLRQESTTKNPNSTRSTKPVSQNSVDQMKKNRGKQAKSVTESLANSSVTENLQSEDVGKDNLTCEMNSTSTTPPSLLVDQLLAEEGTEASESHNQDHCVNNHNSCCQVTPQTSQHESGIEPAEEANLLVGHEPTERKTVETAADLKALLLSSPSFFSCVEELFDFNVNQPIIFQKLGIEEVGLINARPFLDCANELMERKSLLTSEVAYSLLWVPNPRINISLDQLMEEVCDGIENLISYSKVGDILPIDCIYVMLERDLRGKEVVLSGTWDMGWTNGFSVDEAGQLVGEVEKQVLDVLIEEVIIDIVG